MDFLVSYLALFCLFSVTEYPVNAGVPQGSILDPTLFYYASMTFLMMLPVILLSILIYAYLPSTLSSPWVWGYTGMKLGTKHVIEQNLANFT